MNVSKNERFSAMVDDETQGFELRRLSDELLQTPEDLQRWERYHLIGDAMRGHLAPQLDQRFAQGIMAQLEQEPSIQAAPQRSRLRHAKPVLGFGMAAAVAVAVLVGLQNLVDGQNTYPALGPGMAAETPEQQNIVPVFMTASPNPFEVSPPVFHPNDARFNAYIINHAEHAGGRGIMPYVRVVGYEQPGE